VACFTSSGDGRTSPETALLMDCCRLPEMRMPASLFFISRIVASLACASVGPRMLVFAASPRAAEPISAPMVRIRLSASLSDESASIARLVNTSCSRIVCMAVEYSRAFDVPPPSCSDSFLNAASVCVVGKTVAPILPWRSTSSLSVALMAEFVASSWPFSCFHPSTTLGLIV